MLNELGLALAHRQLNHAAEAHRWLDQAPDDFKQYDDHVRDRANRRLPPCALTDWLEIQVLLREALSLVGKNRLADAALADQTVTAGQLLRLAVGPGHLPAGSSHDCVAWSLPPGRAVPDQCPCDGRQDRPG